MTKEEEVYVGTLELLGTGVTSDEIQAVLDKEHAAADPAWWRKESARRAQLARTSAEKP